MKSTSRSDVATAPAISERLHRIFEEDLKMEVLSAETDLFDAGVLDSLGFVELLVKIEEEFGRRVALEELELADFRSIATIAAFLARNGNGM